MEPVDLELKPDSKNIHYKYYPVPRINKQTFQKELKHLVKIVVLTLVQQIKFSNPLFIIPKK